MLDQAERPKMMLALWAEVSLLAQFELTVRLIDRKTTSPNQNSTHRPLRRRGVPLALVWRPICLSLNHSKPAFETETCKFGDFNV